MHKKFSRSLDRLDRVFDFVKIFTEQNGLHPAAVQAINLAIEEIFTNMVKYNPDKTEPVFLDLQVDNEKAVIIMTDYEENPFDLTSTSVYDLNKPLEDRPVGKLGLHLVKKVMDKVEYNHADGKTVIVMTKYLGE
jgi:anti-sigma regulatory factor (Ser/Thr protein kinase)